MAFYGPMMEVLALLAVVLTPAAVVVAAALGVPGARARIRRVPGVERGAVWGAWVVATTATAASLFLSEVVGFPPCSLCWVQRAAMYPLVPVLGGALLLRRLRAARWAWPLAAGGLAVAIYHAVVQLQPSLDVVSCTSDAPCTARWVAVFGFVSIPWLAGAAFVLIAVLLGVSGVASGGRPSTAQGG